MKTSLTTSKSTVVRRVLAVVMIAALAATALFSAVAFADAADTVGTAASSSLKQVYDILLKLSVPIVIIYVALAAFQFFLGGDKGPDKARKVLIYGAIGIAVLYSAPLIVDTIITAIKGNVNTDEAWENAVTR